MKRSIAFAVVVLAASAAQAASLTVSRELVSGVDPNNPGPGDVIRVLVTAHTEPSDLSTVVFAALQLSSADVTVLAPGITQTSLEWLGGLLPWGHAGPDFCPSLHCTVINQQSQGGFPEGLPVTNTPFVIARGDFLITGPGPVYASWDAASFNFFSAPVPEDFCVTCPIPEPATGALLALGLAALATAARRRTR